MEIEKTLGILIEQGRWMAQEIAALREDVKGLNEDRWKRSGMMVLASTLVSILVFFLSEYLRK